MVTPAVMVLGTASSVGKSLVAAAICRLLADRGLRVAPFKAQNMSLEAAVTPGGAEIGRAQYVQAVAARRVPVAEMNPILLKPAGESRSQVVLLGEALGDEDAWRYHCRRAAELFPAVLDAYRRLAADADVVVLEGAGSPAEINLRAGDIVNMRMAHAADARCLLVTDIDRGGAFAAVAGTLALLDEGDRARIAGFALNKFRGDVALLQPGVTAIEVRESKPCLGVIPWLDDIAIDDEDGYAAAPWPPRWDRGQARGRRLRIAAVAYPHASNLADLEPLRREPSVQVRRATTAADVETADVVVLPGSKSTVSDLLWLRNRAIAQAIVRHAAERRPIIGICGGYQMLGARIDDAHEMESGDGPALAILDATTSLRRKKSTVRVSGVTLGAPRGSVPFHGYEIHLGESRTREESFARVSAGTSTWHDGAVSADGAVIGTYVHDIFAADPLRHAFVADWRARSGLAPAEHLAAEASVSSRIDRWARHVGAHLDLDRLLDGRAPRLGSFA